jgi:predicted PurR-regulated permease PerM
MRALAALLCLAAAAVLVPFWMPLVLAAWSADLLGGWASRLAGPLRSRSRAAVVLMLMLVAFVLLPLAGVGVALSLAMEGLTERYHALLEGRGTLTDVLTGGAPVGAPPDVPNWSALASRYGASAWGALSSVASAGVRTVVGGLVFFAAFYSFIVDGAQIYAWLERSAPIPREALGRLAAAFRETGRGLIVAGGGTALVQGVLATVGYLAIGVPRALVLGPLTALCALVPFIGTALVWIPLGIELATSGHHVRAVLVLALGSVVSIVDNLVRPMLARYGRLTLPTVVVFLSMLGGVALVGPTGALLGPLLVRLGVCAIGIVAEQPPVRATEPPPPEPPA